MPDAMICFYPLKLGDLASLFASLALQYPVVIAGIRAEGHRLPSAATALSLTIKCNLPKSANIERWIDQ
jgi:hypothetical protein